MEESLPNIIGDSKLSSNLGLMYTSPTSALGTGALTKGGAVPGVHIMGNASATSYKLLFNASRVSSAYKDNAPVIPQSMTTAFLMKY